MLTVGSLFSGIGGIDLGLERAGMKVLWQVEKDPYARRVLRRQWPQVLCHFDIRDTDGTCVPRVDVLAGGFPCQDISVAGKGKGIKEGTRSGLWSEFHRLIRELRPRYVLVENVPALRSRGLDRVLGDLAASGYDAEWDGFSASAFGAPHRRDRIFIVAYPQQQQQLRQQPGGSSGTDRTRSIFPAVNGEAGDMANSECVPRDARGPVYSGEGERGRDSNRSGERATLANANGAGLAQRVEQHPWAVEPDVGRVAHGVPARVDRLRCLGNAVVPQVAEYVGRLIVGHVEAKP